MLVRWAVRRGAAPTCVAVSDILVMNGLSSRSDMVPLPSSSITSKSADISGSGWPGSRSLMFSMNEAFGISPLFSLSHVRIKSTVRMLRFCNAAPIFCSIGASSLIFEMFFSCDPTGGDEWGGDYVGGDYVGGDRMDRVEW